MAKHLNEKVRKLVVSIKRNPTRIGLIAFIFSFIYYSLNLTCISNTTAKIQGPGMGLCGFVTMLFSILSIVSYLNSFPRRKKPNIPMLIVMAAMVCAVIFCDLRYRNLILRAVKRADNPIAITENTMYILKAYTMLFRHVIFLGVSSVLTALSPLYVKLLRRIDTSVEIDGYSKMKAIDLSKE